MIMNDSCGTVYYVFLMTKRYILYALTLDGCTFNANKRYAIICNVI